MSTGASWKTSDGRVDATKGSGAGGDRRGDGHGDGSDPTEKHMPAYKVSGVTLAPYTQRTPSMLQPEQKGRASSHYSGLGLTVLIGRV